MRFTGGRSAPPSGAGPSAESSPNGGFQFFAVGQPQQDQNGYFQFLEVLFNPTGVDNAQNACHLLYNYLNSTYVNLYNDAGTAPVSPQIYNVPSNPDPQYRTHGNQLAYNSQCMLDTYNLLVYFANLNPGKEWYLFYPLYFFPHFNGTQNVYMKMTSTTMVVGPWVQVATWTAGNSASSDPTVTITSPGSTATGTVAISGAVSDPNSAIGSVVIYIDGLKKTPAATVDNTAHTYTWSWNTTTSGAGVHTITVLATDGDTPINLRSVVSKTVTVN